MEEVEEIYELYKEADPTVTTRYSLDEFTKKMTKADFSDAVRAIIAEEGLSLKKKDDSEVISETDVTESITEEAPIPTSSDSSETITETEEVKDTEPPETTDPFADLGFDLEEATVPSPHELLGGGELEEQADTGLYEATEEVAYEKRKEEEPHLKLLEKQRVALEKIEKERAHKETKKRREEEKKDKIKGKAREQERKDRLAKDIDFQKKVEALSIEDINKDEETLVPEMNKKFNRSGILFQESSAGDSMTLTTIDGKHSTTINLQAFSPGNQENALEKLQTFIRHHSSLDPLEKERPKSRVEQEAYDFYEKRGMNYGAIRRAQNNRNYLQRKLALIENILEKGIDGYSEKDAEEFPEVFVKSAVGGKGMVMVPRSDLQGIYDKAEEDEGLLKDAVGAEAFDIDFIEAAEDFDQFAAQRRQELQLNYATNNKIAKTAMDFIEEQSLDYFGKSLRDITDADMKSAEDVEKLREMDLVWDDARELQDQASDLWLDSRTFLSLQQNKSIENDFEDSYYGAEGIYNELGKGWNQGQACQEILALTLGIEDLENPADVKKCAEQIIANLKEKEQFGTSRAMHRWNQAKGAAEGWAAFVNDPGELALSLTANSLSSMLPYGLKMVGTAMVAGTTTGLVLGSTGFASGLTGIATTLAGGAAGFVEGGRLGMAATMFAMEYTNSILDVIREKGYDMMNPESLAEGLQDPDVWREGGARGIKRGIPIAIVDYLSAGLAGKLFSKGKYYTAGMGLRQAATLSKSGMVVTEQMLFGPGAEAIGEATAMIMAGQKLDAKEIMAEAFGALGNNFANLTWNLYQKNTKAAKIEYAEELTNVENILKDGGRFGVSSEKLSAWSTQMKDTGQIDSETDQKIQENIGIRDAVNEDVKIGIGDKLIGTVDRRKNEGKIKSRIAKLYAARKQYELKPDIFSSNISEINKEINGILNYGKLADKPIALPETAISYKINGKKVSKKKMEHYLKTASPEKLHKEKQTMENAPLHMLEKLNSATKRAKDAIQERSADEVLSEVSPPLSERVEQGDTKPGTTTGQSGAEVVQETDTETSEVQPETGKEVKKGHTLQYGKDAKGHFKLVDGMREDITESTYKFETDRLAEQGATTELSQSGLTGEIYTKEGTGGQRTILGTLKDAYKKARDQDTADTYDEVEVEEALTEDGEPDYEADEVLRKIAKDQDLGITSDREIKSVAKDKDGKIIGGTYTSYDNNTKTYTFDVVVDKESEGKGVGTQLLDDVIEIPPDILEMEPDAKLEVDVVSPKMEAMLKKRGFTIKEKIGEHTIMVPPDTKVVEAKTEFIVKKKSDIEKVGKLYVDKLSNNYIEKEGNKWVVKTETEGEVLFTGKTLKEAKEFVGTDNLETGIAITETVQVAPPEVKTETEFSWDNIEGATDKQLQDNLEDSKSELEWEKYQPKANIADINRLEAKIRSVEAEASSREEGKVKEEVVTDEAGNPKTLYHSTSQDFDDFQIMGTTTTESPRLELGVHFGNKEQAKSRAKTKGVPKGKERLISVNIKSKNTKKVQDPGRWTLSAYRKILQDLNLISKERGKAKEQIKSFEDVIKIIKQNKIDAFVYENKYEGKGDSYVVFDTENIIKKDQQKAKEKAGAPIKRRRAAREDINMLREGKKVDDGVLAHISDKINKKEGLNKYEKEIAKGMKKELQDVSSKTHLEEASADIESEAKALKEELKPDETVNKKERKAITEKIDKKEKEKKARYRGTHTAPRPEEGVRNRGDEMSDIYPDDVYSALGERYYGEHRAYDKKTLKIMKEMKGNPNKEITIYRAVPNYETPGFVGEKTIHEGDWVSLSPEYAEEHGAGYVGDEKGGFKVISKKVKVKDLYTDGNSIHEWGYQPAKKERVRKAGEKTDLQTFMERLKSVFPNINTNITQIAFDRMMENPDINLHTKDGKVVYGINKNGEIYLNPAVHNSNSDLYNTAIHEFGEVYLNFLESTPEGKKRLKVGLDLAKQDTKLYEAQLKKFKGNKEMAARETLAILIGNKGETIADASLQSQVKEWINAMWDYVQDTYKSLRGMSIEQVQNLTLDEFVGAVVHDLTSGQEIKTTPETEQQMKDATVVMREGMSADEMISEGRQNGYSDASIRKAVKEAFPSMKMENIDGLMATTIEMDNIPPSFGNVEGGMSEGILLYSRIRSALQTWKNESTRTGPQIRNKVQELLKSDPIYKEIKGNTSLQKLMQTELDTSLDIQEGRSISRRMAEIKSQLGQRKIGKAELKRVQAKLKNLIRDTMPRSAYSVAQINKALAIVNNATPETIQAQTDKVTALIKQKKEQIKRDLIKKWTSTARKLAKKLVDRSSKVKSSLRVDARGQQFFSAVSKVLSAASIINTDKRAAALLPIEKQLFDTQSVKIEINGEQTTQTVPLIGTLTPEMDSIVTKNATDPNSLTTKETYKLNLLAAYNKLSTIMTMELPDVEAVVQEMVNERGESAAQLNANLSARAERNRQIKEQADNAADENYGKLYLATDENGKPVYKNRKLTGAEKSMFAEPAIQAFQDTTDTNDGSLIVTIDNKKFKVTAKPTNNQVTPETTTDRLLLQSDIDALVEENADIYMRNLEGINLQDAIEINENNEKIAQLKEAISQLAPATYTVELQEQVMMQSDELADNFPKMKSWRDANPWGKYVKGQIKKMRANPTAFFNRMSWGENLGTMTRLMDNWGTFFETNVYKRINKMTEAALKGLYQQRDHMSFLADAVPGNKDGIKGIQKNKIVSKQNHEVTLIDRDGKPFVRKYSGSQLMRIYALSKNKLQRHKMKTINSPSFTEATFNQIEAILEPDLVNFVDNVVDYLSNQYFESVNGVYKNVNNVSMDYVDNYFPTRTDVGYDTDSDIIQQGDFGKVFTAQYASALKQRNDTAGAVKTDGFGFFSELDDHFEQMEKFKAMAEGVQDLNALFNSPKVKAALKAMGSGDYMRQLLNVTINPNSFIPQQTSKVEMIFARFTQYVLGYKLIQVAKQASSFINAFEDFRYHKGERHGVAEKAYRGTEDAIMFMVGAAKVIAKLRTNLAQAKKMSATFRHRLENADLYALESGRGLKKGELTRLSKMSAAPTVWGDIMGVMGYMINYNQDIANGMNKEVAAEKFNDYNETQQTRRSQDLTPLQAYKNFLMRGFLTFGSASILQLQKVIVGTRNIMRDSLTKGKSVSAKDIRAVAINLGVTNALFTFTSNFLKFGYGDDEEERALEFEVLKALVGVRMIATAVPILGAAFEHAYDTLAGNTNPYKKVPVNPAYEFTAKLLRTMREPDVEKKQIEALKIIIGITTGQNIEPFHGLYDLLKDYEKHPAYSESLDDAGRAFGISQSYRARKITPQNIGDTHQPLVTEEAREVVAAAEKQEVEEKAAAMEEGRLNEIEGVREASVESPHYQDFKRPFKRRKRVVHMWGIPKKMNEVWDKFFD